MSAFLINDQFHIRLFLTGFLKVQAGDWSTRNVKDSIWRFYMNDRDGASVEFSDSRFYFRAGRLYLIPAEVLFSCHSDAAFQHFYIHFDVLGISRALKQQLFSAPIELAPNAALENESRALAKIAQITGRNTLDFATQFRVQAFMVGVFAHHLQTLCARQKEALEHSSSHQAPIAPALEFIEKNLANEITNANLARLCGLSEDHFARRFREIIGETPGQFVRNRRVAIASQALLFSSDSIDEIACRTGFCNRFYFSRVFTSQMKMPPAAYRKMTRP